MKLDLSRQIRESPLRTSPDTIIITPTLGDRPSIERTVSSVHEIGGDRVKHVIVCPSRQQSILIARFPHCEVLAEKEKCGVFQAVNDGLWSTMGECKYVGYINDDDYWLPNFERLFRLLDSAPELSVAYARVLFVDEENEPIFESTSSSRYQAFKRLLANGAVVITQQASLVRREVFASLGGFDKSYLLVADSDFWLRAIDAGCRMGFVNKPCAAYMIQRGQLSSNPELAKLEYDRLLQQHAIVKDWNAYFEFLRYRVENLPNYLKRLGNRRLSQVKSLLSN